MFRQIHYRKGDMKEATNYATTQQQHQKLLLKACGGMKG
jgi:hypothetical protein